MNAAACRLAATAVIATLAAWPAAAQDEVLFEEASSGLLELAGQSRLEIEGFQGTVFVRAGKADELRYSAATRAARRAPREVALWLRGGTMIFRPVQGREADELILEIAVSEGVRVDIRKQGGKVQVASVQADVYVEAVGSDVDIRGAGEGVEVRLEQGSLNLENLRGPTTIDGEAVGSVTLSRLGGRTHLALADSAVAVHTYASGELEVDLNETPLEVRGSAGSVIGNAVGGRVELNGVRGGASLQLEEAPLTLVRCDGRIVIDTDSEVTFNALQGTLEITGYGAPIVGDGHEGSVTVASRDATVELKNIAGPLVLNGQGLNVKVGGVTHQFTAELADTELEADGMRGGFEVSNEFGDITVRAVQGPTRIVSRNGSVRATDLAGSVEIEAEGPEVRVVWSELGRDRDSVIRNDGGDLYVSFPIGAGARVEAEAGSVETDLENIRVEDDGRTAHGLVGEVDTPTVTLKAAGRLVLARGAVAQ